VSPPDPDDYLKVKFKKLRVPVVGKQWIIQSLLSQVTDHTYLHTPQRNLALPARVMSFLFQRCMSP
jgi:hypothetical protein